MNIMQSVKEKIKYLFLYFLSPREILVIFTLLFLSVFFFLAFLYRGSTYLTTERIVYAGKVTEGVIGTPKETNPYKAESPADKDLQKLLYSSLIKNLNIENGTSTYALGLAESVDVSSDKNIYKVTLRPNILFSNGTPITQDDIIYSLNNVPLEKNYSVEKSGENSLTFKLKKNDPNFLLDLTYPITKKDIPFENNLSVDIITSSFFKISKISKDSDGNIQSITLSRFDNGEAKLPYLETYTIRYFQNEIDAYNAFQKKEIHLLSGIPGTTISKLKDDTSIKFEVANLPNNFSVFLNQNKNEYLQNSVFRQALSDIIDRESLTNQVLGSFGIPTKNILGEKGTLKPTKEVIDSLGSSFSFENGVLYSSTKKSSETKTSDTNAKSSDKTAVKIKLTTIQNSELEETAKFLQTSWKKIGVETEIIVVDRKDLNNIVRDRDFEGLLFGYSIKNEKDYYSFFSSKERTYPKLNISNYTSKQTDKILDVLSGDNSEPRVKDLLNQLSVEISADNPVIILYKPQFVFAHFLAYQIKLPNKIQSEEERYAYIENWYTNTEKVLSIFKNSKIVDRLDTLLY